MRTFTITVGYNVCHAIEVQVRASAVAWACERALAIADASAEGWRATDGASESYVEAIGTAGKEESVPLGFSEAGILAPEVLVLREGLDRVVGIGEANCGDVDASEMVSRMVAAARAALEKARKPVRCETCGGRGRLENAGDYLGTETCPICTGTGRVTP